MNYDEWRKIKMIENLLIMESLAKNENKMLCKADCTINGIAN